MKKILTFFLLCLTIVYSGHPDEDIEGGDATEMTPLMIIQNREFREQDSSDFALEPAEVVMAAKTNLLAMPDKAVYGLTAYCFVSNFILTFCGAYWSNVLFPGYCSNDPTGDRCYDYNDSWKPIGVAIVIVGVIVNTIGHMVLASSRDACFNNPHRHVAYHFLPFLAIIIGAVLGSALP